MAFSTPILTVFLLSNNLLIIADTYMDSANHRLFQSWLRPLIFADIEHEELRNLLITKELQRYMVRCRTALWVIGGKWVV